MYCVSCVKSVCNILPFDVLVIVILYPSISTPASVYGALHVTLSDVKLTLTCSISTAASGPMI